VLRFPEIYLKAMVPVLKPPQVLRFPEIYPKAMVPVLKPTSSAKVSRNIPQGYGSSPETHLKC
jgi:hypothetical protein